MEEVWKILPVVLKRSARLGGPTVVEILAPLWARVAGKAIAQHSRPVRFEGDTLTLATSCLSWTTQLRLMAEELRAAINGFLGQPIVKKLVIQRRATLERLDPTPREQEVLPHLEPNRLEGAPGTTQLGSEMAQIIERSFTKYFARKTRKETRWV